MKKLFLFLVMLMCTLFTFAIPADNVTITHTQKDGTVLTLRLVGDEHMHYYINMATGQAMRKGADGDFVEITSAQLLVQAEQATARRTEANKQRIARLPRMQQMQTRPNGPSYAIGHFGTMTGTKKGLVILVNFTDVTFKTGATSTKKGNTTVWDYTGTQAAFNNQFNQQGYSQNGHIGSVKDYFSAQSYETFTVDFDVVGPVTVSNAMAYYGAPKGNDNDSYPASMVIEACKLADEAGVDFSKYDWTGDGYVDQVFVIYAGYNEAQGASKNTIWPHEWDLNSAKYYGDGTGAFQLDGKWIKTYACTSELAGYSGTTMDGIGTACHEFSHCLGYPDLYDTDYAENGSGFGMSYYDLMASGSYNGPNGRGEIPCGYSAYERWMAGWITPTELNADAATITDMATIDKSTARAYIIKNGSDNNYYLLENRPNTGYFQYFSNKTSGSGLFITHVNYNATAWQNNTVNAYENNQRFIFIPADGTRSTSSGYTTDFFPTSSVSSFTEVANKQITNIAKTNGLISFDYNGGLHDDGSRYTITFNAGAGTCSTANWTQTEYQQSYTLPTPTINIDGWTFAGWTTSAVNTETSTAPTFKGTTYCPTQNTTLYAVYQKTTQIGGDSKFYKNSTLSALTANTEYVFVAADGYALDASELSGTASSNVAGTAVTVTNGAISTTNDNLIWTCASVAGSNIELKNGTDYLRIRSTGLTKTTSSTNDTKWSSTNGLYYSTSSNTYNIKFNSTNKTFGSASTVDANTRVYAFVRTSKVTNITTYNSNPQPETAPDPEPGDGGDEPGEGEGGDITITPISGIPNGYYNNSIVGKNDRTLELALKAIVNPHTKIAYNSLWRAYETTDVVPTALLKDPAKTDQVYDMYADINKFTKYYSDNDHSQTGGINREHCVPNSWWGGESGNATAYTDLHHLVPSDGAANNAKSNHPLGEYKSGMTLSWPTETKSNSGGYTYVEADNTSDHSGSWSHIWNATSSTKVFEPANEFKGDFARMYLYVVCAYEGDLTWQTDDNTMFSNGANNYTTIAPEAKALLLKWHRQDPVSDKERLRNNAVQSIQGNRNPFIDYPILVEYVWGDSIAKNTFSLERMPSAYQFGVTYHVGQNVTCDEQVRICDRGGQITLPVATTTVEGWTFCGWTKSPIANTTTAPTTLLTGSYTPLENIELYAVFQAGGTYSIAPEELDIPGVEDGVAALYFPHIAKLGQPFTAPAFSTDSDGAKTWTSSNTTVAEVDNDGHVTIKAVGTTIITVTQAETATYCQGSASYMIKVVE